MDGQGTVPRHRQFREEYLVETRPVLGLGKRKREIAPQIVARQSLSKN